MHRCLVALAALAFVASCNKEDPAALFADIAYQVRCLDCQPVTTDSPARDVSVVDGQNGTALSCEYINGRVTLHISNAEYGFDILGARLGDDPGDQCEVRVKEGSGNEYAGSCKPAGSSGGAPCEVELMQDGSGFSGTILCKKIPHRRTTSLFRYVVSPRTTDEPAEISVQGCSGL